MVNYVASKYNFSGASLTGIEGVNTGIVVPWGSATIPSGFQLCDGSAISRTTFAALFAVIGTTYGVGNGTTTFNVPDLRDRTIVGVSSANSKALAQSIGANTVTPTGNIGGSAGSTTLTTNEIPSHSHGGGNATMSFTPNLENPGGAASSMNTGNTGGGGSHSHNLSANFTGSANSVLQPGLVLNYIIKT